MGDIQRAKVGKWEKAGYLLFFGSIFPALIISDVFEALGFEFWGRVGLTGLLCLGVGYLVSRPASAGRSRRLASDLRHGIFDCAVRYPDSPPGSLRHRWTPGVAQLVAGKLHFQTQNAQWDPSPTPLGAPRDLGVDKVEGVTPLEGRRPVELRRGWKVLGVGTSSGKLHLAAGDPALELLREEFPG